MSNFEPSTTAKVILHTTKGPIEIELWAKEVPMASRNFLQLCLNGYYDNCEFFRVVPDFVIQAGDPTGTGYGGDYSIYDGKVFKDEFHSRIKYSHRGMVGCANAGTRNTNGSQFMITLAATPELDHKNTCFGTVIGDTLYNVIKISEGEIEKDEKPLFPTKIKSTEVVIPYFEDLELTKSKGEERENEEGQSKGSKFKKKKNKKLVSMNFDDGEDEEGPVIVPKIKKKPGSRSKGAEPEPEAALVSKKSLSVREEDEPPEKMQTTKNASGSGQTSTVATGDSKTYLDVTNDRSANKQPTEVSDASKLEDEFAQLKASLKKSKSGPQPKEEEKPAPTLTPLQQEQEGYNQGKKSNKMSKKELSERESNVLAMLEKFKSKISGGGAAARAAPTDDVNDNGSDSEPELGSDDELPSDYEEKESRFDVDWMNHRFEAEKEAVQNEDLLVTIDPKEKKRKQDEIYKKEDPRGAFKKRTRF